MRCQNLAVSAALLACVVATPFKPVTRRANPDYTYNQNGNIKLKFSDDTVQIGDAPISVLMGNVSTACPDQGPCDNNAITITDYSLVYAGFGTPDQLDITISSNGDYETWVHNGLLDSLSAALNVVANCTNVTSQPPCIGYETSCVAQPEFTAPQCTVPSFWSVSYQDTSGAPSTVYVDIASKIDRSSGFCSTFTTIGNAVGDAIGGLPGGVFTLLSLGCNIN